MRKIICVECGRDINAIGQDNMSREPLQPLCEDCASDLNYGIEYEIEEW